MNSSARLQAQGNGLSSGPGQARGLDRRLAAVFAAEAGAKVRRHHAHLLFGEMEGAREFGADAKRVLRAGPDRQFAIGPLGDGGPGFERGVLGVSDVVGLAQDLFGLGQIIGKGIGRHSAASVLGQKLEKVPAGGVGRLLPASGLGDGGQGRARLESGGRGHADELLVAHHHHLFHGLGGSEVNLGKPGVKRGGTQDSAEEHPGPGDVRRELVGASDQVPSVGTVGWDAQDLPLLDRGKRDIGGDGLVQPVGIRFAPGQIGIGQGAPGGWVEGLTLTHLDSADLDTPFASRELGQQLAGGGGALSYRRHGPRRAPAPGRHAVVRRQTGVGQDKLNTGHRHA